MSNTTQTKLYNTLNKQNIDLIINWLDKLKDTDNIINDKVPGLLNNTRLQINTKTETGSYNLILKWIKININKFPDYDFGRIPESSFTSLKNMNNSKAVDNIDTDEAIKLWCKNPLINPYTNNAIKVSILHTSEYAKLYQKFCSFLTDKIISSSSNPEGYAFIPDNFERLIRDKLPNNHIYVFKDFDYIQTLQNLYPNSEWINFLNTKKEFLYEKNEKSKDIFGSTVYDFLFAKNFLFLNKKHFTQKIREEYIDRPLFLYETIEEQIKTLKKPNSDIYEIFESLCTTQHINIESPRLLINIRNRIAYIDKYPLEIPPLIFLFTEYIQEISYYLLSILYLDKEIYNNYFLYGKNEGDNKYEVITESIDYNIYRLKTILNIIFSTVIKNNNEDKIKTFFDNTFLYIGEYLYSRTVIKSKNKVWSDREKEIENILTNISRWTKPSLEVSDIYTEEKFKTFFVSSIFDIQKLHIDSAKLIGNLYEPIKDPYDNLPEQPQFPKPPIIDQQLQKYKMTSHIIGKNQDKENELKSFEKKQTEYKKELKKYDKELQNYNNKYLDKKLSPYFSVKLARSTGDIDKRGSLQLRYSPIKSNAKSLEEFKLNRYKNKKRSKSSDGKKENLKIKLALESDNFKQFAKSLSPSGKSPRQKYMECDLNDVDPITNESFRDMHFNKIKYLSKIKTINPNGKVITKCYDTIPLYNYILDCNSQGVEPKNIAFGGRESFTGTQLDEVFKKIKFFTKKPTISRNTDVANTNLLVTNAKIVPYFDKGQPRIIGNERGYMYTMKLHISIGSILFPVIIFNNRYAGGLNAMPPVQISLTEEYPVIQGDEILFEDSSDNTIILIQKGVANSSLLQFSHYPYWNGMRTGIRDIGRGFVKNFINIPVFTWSETDTIDVLRERTKVFNRRIAEEI